MKKMFVPISNHRRLLEAIKRLEARGAPEASSLLVSGAPGRGKAHLTYHWAVEAKAIYLRSNAGWTPNQFMRAMAENLNVDQRSRDLFQRLHSRMGALGFPALCIDEVQHCLANRAEVLETVRDFSDRTKSIVVLVAGEDGVMRRLKELPQIASRIGEVVEFELASIDDVSVICKTLAECDIKPDLVAQIHRTSGGVLRQIMNAIAAVEGVAKASGISSIDAAQFKTAGIPLCVDWQAGARRQGGAV